MTTTATHEGGRAVIMLDDPMENHMSDPQGDPQTHLDTDPVNDPEPDVVDDPAHDTDEDEGWGSEGGATPDGPATDT